MGDNNREHNPTQRKRGISNSMDYRRNKVKVAKIKGLEHVNYSGKVIPAKTIGKTCNCPQKCVEKIETDNQIDILNKFLNINSKDEQDLYLQNLIECHDVKRHRPRKEGSQLKSKSFIYHSIVGNVRTRVCREAFFSLHAVTDKRVKRLRGLLVNGQIPVDKRGKAKSANAMSGDELAKVHEHINTFPVKESHYSGKTVNYLDCELNVKIMYSLFKDKHPSSTIKYEYYNKIFKENFNLRFGRPQVDVCCQCELLSVKIKNKSLNETARRVSVAELMVHKRRAKKFYSALKSSKKLTEENSEILAISFDFMQNLHLPRVPAQDLFYLRQLTVNVFGVHNMKDDSSVFFLYHEGIAHKGPDEVCSFIYTYLNHYVSSEVKEIHFFSDNCAAQNKNHCMIRMCQALVDCGKYRRIEQFFPIRGHSFLPSDRDFGVIKRKLRKLNRAYTIMDYVERL
jgi:hypothetical protein